jgi:hypothetical protein
LGICDPPGRMLNVESVFCIPYFVPLMVLYFRALRVHVLMMYLRIECVIPFGLNNSPI